MKKKTLIIVLMMTVCITIYLVSRRNNNSLMTRISYPVNLVLKIENPEEAYPFDNNKDTVIRHTGYDLKYNEEYEQAAWVIYILTREEVLSGNSERTENFRPDTSVVTGSAALKDYAGSGYDRGHLAPAADMKWSLSAMSESFLLSNISPQVPGFNRGVWSRLESKVRDWAVENDSVLVITGPVLKGITKFIGENRVGVPQYYFKVITDISAPDYKAIAFILENRSSRADLFSFAVTVDSLENLTGYNFFSSLPDQDVIEKMESMLVTSDWK